MSITLDNSVADAEIAAHLPRDEQPVVIGAERERIPKTKCSVIHTPSQPALVLARGACIGIVAASLPNVRDAVEHALSMVSPSRRRKKWWV